MMSDSEAASKKLGRPAVFSDAKYSVLENVYRDIKTKRGLQNKGYQGEAIEALRGYDGFSWLFDLEAMQAGKSNSLRPGILTELGRVHSELGEEALLSIARSIVAMDPKPTTKAAIAKIRRWRLNVQGKAKDLSQDEHVELISESLIKRLNEYLDKNPGVEMISLELALNSVLEVVEKRRHLQENDKS